MTRPRASTSSRSTRTRPAVTYKEPRDDGERSSSDSSGDERDDTPHGSAPPDGEHDDDNVDATQPRATSGDPAKRRTKRQRGTVAAGTRKSRAKKPFSLSRLVSLPLDVLATVLSECDLQSLFYLSRINKRFRTFLLSSSMKGIWLACWRNSLLPDWVLGGTNGLGILKWSNLLFGDCQVCGSKTNNVEPRLRVKACAMPSSCFSNLTIHSVKVVDEPTMRDLTNWVAWATPKQGRNSRPMFLLADFTDAAKGIAAADNATDKVRETGTFEHRRFGSIPLKGLREHLVNRLSQQHEEGDAIDRWLAMRKVMQSLTKAQINKQRVDDIKSRFFALDFKEEHFDGAILNHKQMRAARPLTDSNWPTVRDALLPQLEVARDLAISRELGPIRDVRRSKLYEQWLALDRRLGPDQVASLKGFGFWPIPLFSDLVALESFRELYWPVDAEVGDTTLFDHARTLGAELSRKKEALSSDFFKVVKDALELDEGQRRRETTETEGGTQLGPYFDKWLSDEHSDEDKKAVLGSCLAVFRCEGCRLAIDTFPNILSHACDWGSAESLLGGGGGRGPAPRIAHAGLLSSRLYKVLWVDVFAVMKILSVAGLVEHVELLPLFRRIDVHHAQLEQLGNAFSCVKCPPSFETMARNWTGFAMHLAKYHGLDPPEGHQGQPPLGDLFVCEPPAVAQLRLIKAHEDWHKDNRGIY